MLIAALMSVLALTDPDGVVATAPTNAPVVTAALTAPAEALAASPTAQDAAPHGLTTEQQIQQWIDSRAPGESFEEALAAAPADDRQMHGMVEAGIGTGGYRSYGASVSLPVGESGRLDLSYREGRNDYYGYGYGYGAPFYGYSGRAWPNRYSGADSRSRSMSLGFSWERDRQADR